MALGAVDTSVSAILRGTSGRRPISTVPPDGFSQSDGNCSVSAGGSCKTAGRCKSLAETLHLSLILGLSQIVQCSIAKHAHPLLTVSLKILLPSDLSQLSGVDCLLLSYAFHAVNDPVTRRSSCCGTPGSHPHRAGTLLHTAQLRSHPHESPSPCRHPLRASCTQGCHQGRRSSKR